MRFVRERPIVGLLLGALLTLGCGRLQRAEQCERLAKTVNPELSEIEKKVQGDQSPAELRAIADGYDDIAKSLAPLEFSKKSLADAVTEYGRNLKLAAREARRAASAKESGNRDEHMAARREIGAISRPLSMARARIESDCQ
jgi:hypothetical protein